MLRLNALIGIGYLLYKNIQIQPMLRLNLMNQQRMVEAALFKYNQC